MSRRIVTKAELRREIEQLRNVGAQMANICWNVAQGRTLSKYERDIVDGVRQEWDAIKRREPSGIAARLSKRATPTGAQIHE